jgi:hypothetical protein
VGPCKQDNEPLVSIKFREFIVYMSVLFAYQDNFSMELVSYAASVQLTRTQTRIGQAS